METINLSVSSLWLGRVNVIAAYVRQTYLLEIWTLRRLVT